MSTSCLCVSSSFKKVEAMACGLPIIASNILGNVDLIDDKGGYLVASTDADGFAEAVRKLMSDPAKQEQMCKYNLDKIHKIALMPSQSRWRRSIRV